MARTVRDAKLETRTARAALKASGKPYYRAIDEGLHLGYRKGQTAGKWVMRGHVGGKEVYRVETIGVADDTIDADGATILRSPKLRRKPAACSLRTNALRQGCQRTPPAPTPSLHA